MEGKILLIKFMTCLVIKLVTSFFLFLLLEPTSQILFVIALNISMYYLLFCNKTYKYFKFNTPIL